MIAADFVREMDACMQRIGRFPEAGSLRYTDLPDVEGLRFSIIERFPDLVFCFERPDDLDIVRVLHQHQNIPGIFVEQA